MLRQLTAAFSVLLTTTAAAQTPPVSSPAPTPTPVVRSEPASKDELAAISARGKALYDYDQAAWHASDAAMKVLQKMGALQNSAMFYVADRVKDKWVVSFGTLSDDREEFRVVLEAVQDGKTKYKTSKFETPKLDKGRVLNLARAVWKCRSEFKGENRPYNIAVLPAPKDNWYVYVLPAQTDANVFPIGGDVRYTVSQDGKTIIETRQMHMSVNEFQGAPPGRGAPAAMVRTAVLDDVPEDSDVFFALAFKPATPQFLITKNFVYAVTPDGNAQFVAKAADFLKK